MKQGQLYGIDILKFLMSFAVVAIHVEAVSRPETFPVLFRWFISLAVPFFFIVSGYLLESKLMTLGDEAEKKAVISARIKKIFRIFGCWLVIYLPIAVYCYSVEQTPLWWKILSYIKQLLLNGESRYAWPLWFLYSMGISLVIFKCLYFRRKGPLTLGIVFLSIAILNWCGQMHIVDGNLGRALNLFNIMTERTLGGGLYMLAGMLACRCSSNAFAPVIGAVAVIVSVMIYYLSLPLAPLAGGIGLFMMVMNMRTTCSRVAMTLRNYSMWIYYTHMLFIFTYVTLLKPSGQVAIWPLWMGISGATLVLSVILTVLMGIPRVKWLKFLIS